MTIEEILQLFTSDETNDFSSPMNDETHTYATNGEAIIRVKKIKGYEPLTITTVTPSVFFRPISNAKENEFVNPILLSKKPEKCKACRGTGKAEGCDECEEEGYVELESEGGYSYQAECLKCNGSGHVLSETKTCPECQGEKEYYVQDHREILPGMCISSYYSQLLRQLPDIKMLSKSNKQMFYFTFSGGQGAVITCCTNLKRWKRISGNDSW